MKKFTMKQFVTISLIVAILILMAYTPLGYLNIGPLAITFNVIPVAIAAIALGPKGGAIAGAVFGLTSFLQCIGVGGVSAMGAALFSIQPGLAFVQRFVPRVLDGFLLGFICCSAFLNTVFFMTSLVLLFGNTEYVQNLIAGRNIIMFICTFVGVNAVFEMVASTLITCAVGTALSKAGLIEPLQK